MIVIDLKKVYVEYHSIDNPFIVEGNDRFSGLVEHLCDNQTMDSLGLDEQIVATIQKIPFFYFRIIPVTNNGYELQSYSPVSLKTYTEQSVRVEKWGEYDTIGQCVDKIISIAAGFINRMGKEETNDGNYYDS